MQICLISRSRTKMLYITLDLTLASTLSVHNTEFDTLIMYVLWSVKKTMFVLGTVC